jgi:acyl-CoA thioesterase
MTVNENMVNGHGMGHGGYVFTIADTAFAFACNTYNERTVAAGADINFLAPVNAGDILTATAVERSRRGRSGIYDVTVRTADGTVVAEFRGRSRSLGTAHLSD